MNRTAKDVRQLRYWMTKFNLPIPPDLMAVGSEEAQLNDDRRKLPMLELFLRTAQRERGMKRAEALRWWAESCVTEDGKQLFGKNTDAVFDRLRRKLQSYAKRDIAALWQEITDQLPESDRSAYNKIDPRSFTLG